MLAGRDGSPATVLAEARLALDEARRMPAFDRVRVFATLAPILCEAGQPDIARAALEELLGQLAPMEAEYAQLLARFKPDYPKVVQMKAQIAETRQRISAETARVVAGVESAFFAADGNSDYPSVCNQNRPDYLFQRWKSGKRAASPPRCFPRTHSFHAQPGW